MIKNSSTMYKVLGLLIAAVETFCLPLAAANITVPLYNSTGAPMKYSVTQKGHSNPVHNNSLAAGGKASLALNNNETYTIAAHTVVSGKSVTKSLQFSTNHLISLVIMPHGTSFVIAPTIIPTLKGRN